MNEPYDQDTGYSPDRDDATPPSHEDPPDTSWVTFDDISKSIDPDDMETR